MHRRESSTAGAAEGAEHPYRTMGREESVAQAKAAQREKEEAAHAKKQARKDAVWEKGAKDTSKDDAASASAAEAAARKQAAAAQVPTCPLSPAAELWVWVCGCVGVWVC